MPNELASNYAAAMFRRAMHLHAGAAVLALLAVVAMFQDRVWLAWGIALVAIVLNTRARVHRERARRAVDWLGKH
jgi:hypothetical protein